jgi:dGTPase
MDSTPGVRTQRSCASHPAQSRGRRHSQAPDPLRDEYQRDRDRIVHSSAFRRMVYKTQVFLNHEGDLFRTRLTHSLEVAQLARSIARALQLNEDLCEAIALAHDLGHTPFGHAGQEALDACLRDADPNSGGFEHNFQSLRVVDRLEQRYPAHDGLNLSFESREGVLKHCSRRHAQWLLAHDTSGLGQRFIDGTQPSLEAQVCDLADAIAYNAHDIDDGVRSGLLDPQGLLELALYREFHQAVMRDHPGLPAKRLLAEILRRLLSALVHDVIATTRAALDAQRPASAADVRRLPKLVQFSGPMMAGLQEVQRFLRHNLYRHPQVQATTDQARRVVRELFDLYRTDPTQMPGQEVAEPPRLRHVADFIAGMTDRFALLEHRRLTGSRLDWPEPARAA